MNATQILNGSQGFAACAFSRSVMANQLAFDVNRAMNKARDAEQTPVADAAVAAELDAVLSTFGLPQPVKLDPASLIDAHAAAYILLRRIVTTPDPETGRAPEYLARRLVALPDAVVSNADRLTAYNISKAKDDAARFARVGPDGKLITVDNTAREAAIRAEGDALAKAMRAEVVAPWLAAVKAYATADDADLIDVVLDGLTDAGRNPAAEITRAADAMQESAAKRYAEGKFARMEASVWALTTAAQKGTPTA